MKTPFNAKNEAGETAYGIELIWQNKHLLAVVYAKTTRACESGKKENPCQVPIKRECMVRRRVASGKRR
jgi:hypothetical protein